ncbi:MAG: formyltransferase [Proteobacteria bacterium]|nr:formyltransferase [Pseudomonadota bacterium]
MKTRAVVFAYSEVGVRCLEVLLAGQVEIPLVVTHDDDPNETRWFASVAELARRYELPLHRAGLGGRPVARRTRRDLAPDFIFSFYYRFLLGEEILRSARRGALNMHGSLLPKFRGRAPVNWALLHGATETGATMHYMVARADAGNIVDQQSVPIGEDDDALTVFRRVTDAAETVLARSLPKLIDGTAASIPQPILVGEYFGRRSPEDGRIDWSRSACDIHNLVRAVAPPYPGAFAHIRGERWTITRTKVLAAEPADARQRARLVAQNSDCVIECRDGGRLKLLAAQTASGPVNLAAVAISLQSTAIDLER